MVHPDYELVIGDLCDAKSMDRALEGINAVVVGIMIASCFYMMKDFTPSLQLSLFEEIGVCALTFLLLLFSRLPSPVIVAICLLLGWII